ncbi:MAG TPA: ABC transporter substrate-binding protein, partial [Polyangiaceae bacterium]|nr:ABC transporter substrate-binding protein [Polyangiaceae bacterium]
MRRWSLCSLALCLFACSGSTSSEDTAEIEDSLEIYSWLAAGGEKEALDALFSLLQDEYPDLSIVNAAAAKPETARDELKDRLLSGDPPDSFQAVGGADLMTWVDQGKMAPIDDLFEANSWLKSFPQPLVDLLSKDGHYYAVPLNIERDNNLYYGKATLEKVGATVPESLEDFYAMCATIEAYNASAAVEDRVVPLSMPPAGWVLALVAFET